MIRFLAANREIMIVSKDRRKVTPIRRKANHKPIADVISLQRAFCHSRCTSYDTEQAKVCKVSSLI